MLHPNSNLRLPPGRRRPALRVAVLFAAGLLVSNTAVGAGRVPLVTAAILWAGGAILVTARRSERWATAALAGCVVAAGVTRGLGEVGDPGRRLAAWLRTQSVDGFVGVVASEPEPVRGTFRVVVVLQAVDIGADSREVEGKILLRVGEGLVPPAYGDRLRVTAPVRPPDGARNPGAFDYADYLGRRGIGGLASVRRPGNLKILSRGHGTPLWDRIILPMRAHIRKTVDRNLSGGPAGLLKGVLLGDKRSVPDDVRDAFTRSGVNHVLAVSGLHVGLIAGVIFFGLRSIGVGRFVTGGATVAGLGLYALITGMPPSVIRAGLTATLLIVGALAGREGDALNALGLAGLLILAWRPGDLYEVGFQLSFVATAGILMLHGPVRALMPIRDTHPIGKWIAAPLAVSLAAQAATGMLVIQTFGVFSVVAPVANLIVVPLVAAGATLGVVTVLAAALVPAAATALNGTNWLLLTGAIEVARVFAAPSWSQVVLPALSPWSMAVCVSAMALCVPEIRLKRVGPWVLIGGLAAANGWVWGERLRSAPGVTLTALDVGQGDGVFIEFPNGRTMLVDAGLRAPGVDKGASVVVPYLRGQGIDRVDVLVASHPHADHIGGLVSVLESIEVGHYLDGGQHYDSWTARRIRTLLKSRGVAYTSVAAGDSLVGLGGAGIAVLHPSADWVSLEARAPHGMNNGSIVMRLTYEGTDVLLTGDIEHETDGVLLRWGRRLRADILKAAHHGSRTSSSPAFLRAVAPDQVIVSCGVRNKFRHPAPEVIERYRALGARVDRTDVHGAIRIRIQANRRETVRWLERDGGHPTESEP